MRKQTIIVGAVVLLGFVGSFVAQRNWLANEAPPELLAGATTEGDLDCAERTLTWLSETRPQRRVFTDTVSVLLGERPPPALMKVAF